MKSIDEMTIPEIIAKYGRMDSFHLEQRPAKVFIGKDDHEHDLEEMAQALYDAGAKLE